MSDFKTNILIIAHRGASSITPENTLKAFKKAIELGADGIEFDVHETKDREIVITHDDDIKRITGKSGSIKDLTLKELKSFNFGEGEKIPTLQELLELVKSKIWLNCEIKVEGVISKLIKIFKENNITDSVIVSSFIHSELLKIQKIDPQIRLASLEPTFYARKVEWQVKREMIQYCIDNKLYAINPFYPLVNQQFVDFAHENNIKVFPWTVDSKPSIRRLIKLGVDGIITNDLVKAKEILNENS